jgi:mannobiose 2-epimerase
MVRALLAQALFYAIERHSYDPVHGGYLEALTQDWQPVADLRLSAKDANEKRSMNTRLHVLEGYANLYRIWPDKMLKEKIAALIRIFLDRIIHPHTAHLILFLMKHGSPAQQAFLMDTILKPHGWYRKLPK